MDAFDEWRQQRLLRHWQSSLAQGSRAVGGPALAAEVDEAVSFGPDTRLHLGIKSLDGLLHIQLESGVVRQLHSPGKNVPPGLVIVDHGGSNKSEGRGFEVVESVRITFQPALQRHIGAAHVNDPFPGSKDAFEEVPGAHLLATELMDVQE